jgi:hypothetical protein
MVRRLHRVLVERVYSRHSEATMARQNEQRTARTINRGLACSRAWPAPPVIR